MKSKYSIYVKNLGRDDAETIYTKERKWNRVEENWDSICNFFNDTGKTITINYAELLDNEAGEVMATRFFPREIVLFDGDELTLDWNFKFEDFRNRFKITM